VKGFRKLIRNSFGFSRSQTNGFIVLLPVVTIILFSEPVYRWWVSQRTEDFSKERAALDSLHIAWQKQKVEENQIPIEEEIPISFFSFDPNTASADELKALGFSTRLSKRLLNYREKGGRFKVKSDLKKLYGLDSAFYQALVPFISLPVEIPKKESAFTPFEKKKPEVFDLNEADTTQLKSVYGIGSVLANRIVKYRDKLGGFITQDQLREVYGLDTAVVKRIVKASYLSQNFSPQKININSAEELALASHPYSSRKIAKAIVAYRFQHGNFSSVDDLRRIHLIDDKVFDRIYPYLTVSE